MSNKYIVVKSGKYLNSIEFTSEDNLNFIPKWSRQKTSAFPFIEEFHSQLVSEQIEGSKWEQIPRNNFKKGNDPYFENDRRKFNKLLKQLI